MNNTARLIADLDAALLRGESYVLFRVGRYTGNNTSVIGALNRRGYQCHRYDGDRYILQPSKTQQEAQELKMEVWRKEQEASRIRRAALANSQQQLQIAIGHLDKVLNGCRNATEQQSADTAAREWLASIGSL